MSVTWESPLAAKAPDPAIVGHPVWRQIAPKMGKGGFLPAEFDDPGAMDANFLRLLYRIRQRAGVPFRIISAARDPQGSVGASKSAHKKRPCRAVDLQVKSNEERCKIIVAAVLEGVRRIGVYPASAGGAGGLHLDAETHPDNPSPRCWTRYS